MSSQPLSSNIQLIERSIFKAIANEAVSKGYFPDLTLFPNTPTGITDYQTALAAIRTAQGFAIEVFGVGSSQSKHQKKIPRIVIVKQNAIPGDIGGDPSRFYEIDTQDPTKYIAKVAPPQTTSFFYSIHLVWNQAVQSRVLSGILALALPKRGYIDLHDNSGDRVFLRQVGFNRIPNTIEGISEEVYIYEVPDVYESDNVTVDVNIAKITEITIDNQMGLPPDNTQGPINIIT